MKKITIEQAEQMMFDTLEEMDLGDRVYEFAQDIFQGFINYIESNHEIEDSDTLGSGEVWYDDIQEEFFRKVYDKLTDHMTR